MKLSIRECILCGNHDVTAVYEPIGGNAIVVHCPYCDLLFSVGSGSGDGVSRNTWKANFGNLRIGKSAVFDSSIKFVESAINLSAIESVLDVGLNRGSFAKHASSRVDCVVGVEPDNSVIPDDLPGNVSVANSTIEDFLQGSVDFFDFVYMSHTLEHLSDPVGVMIALREHISTDGYVYIEVPNVGVMMSSMIVEEVFIDKHVSHFSPTSLSALLTVSGYRVVLSEVTDDVIRMMCVLSEPSKLSGSVSSDVDMMFSRYRKMTEINNSLVFNRVKELNKIIENGNAVVWGAGRIFSLMSFRGLNVKSLKHVVDKYMHGTEIDGVYVEDPSVVSNGDDVIICSREHYDEIARDVELAGGVAHAWLR